MSVFYYNFISLYYTATAFQQLWTTYSWQMDELHEAESPRTAFECCADCSNSDGEKVPLQRPTWPPTSGPHRRRRAPPSAAVRGSAVRPTTASPPKANRRSPAFSVDMVRRWWMSKLSDALRAIAFFATLATVASVPILIVVYRGRAIGWLMSAVFHQDGGRDGRPPSTVTVGSHEHDGGTVDHHRQHSFFLLNYTNSGKLNSWKAVVAALCTTFVQLTAIVAVHRGYSSVAEWLTKYSYRSVYNPRYQSRYTIYMSCFDSANYYSSLVYIAFFKVSGETIIVCTYTT